MSFPAVIYPLVRQHSYFPSFINGHFYWIYSLINKWTATDSSKPALRRILGRSLHSQLSFSLFLSLVIVILLEIRESRVLIDIEKGRDRHRNIDKCWIYVKTILEHISFLKELQNNRYYIWTHGVEQQVLQPEQPCVTGLWKDLWKENEIVDYKMGTERFITSKGVYIYTYILLLLFRI